MPSPHVMPKLNRIGVRMGGLGHYLFLHQSEDPKPCSGRLLHTLCSSARQMVWPCGALTECQQDEEFLELWCVSEGMPVLFPLTHLYIPFIAWVKKNTR